MFCFEGKTGTDGSSRSKNARRKGNCKPAFLSCVTIKMVCKKLKHKDMIQIIKNKRTESLYLGIVLASIIALGLFVQSCSNEMIDIELENQSLSTLKSNTKLLSPDEFEYFGEIIKCQNGELKWQKQLSLILKDNDRLKGNDIVLKDFKYTGKIGSIEELEQIKTEIIGNAVLPVYHSPGVFEVCKRNDVSSKEFKSFLDTLIPTSKSYIVETEYLQNIFEEGDMGTVELEWAYKGNKLNTIALVSDKNGIVYDNLLYFVHFIETKESKSEIGLNTTLRLKSGTEDQSGPVSYNFKREDCAYNYYGIKIWSYSIVCLISGMNNNGQKSIDGCFAEAFSTAAFGFSADARIQKKAIETGDDGFVDFAWAYAYGTMVSISISWNGTGFTISGGGTHANGEEYITPGNLH
jgi:hypothetical protein